MVIVDWFDAAIDHRAADFVRTSQLIRPSLNEVETQTHLTGATSSFLERLHHDYPHRLTTERLLVGENGATWEAVRAAARPPSRSTRPTCSGSGDHTSRSSHPAETDLPRRRLNGGYVTRSRNACGPDGLRLLTEDETGA
jgi:hypothetical protein